MDRPLKVLHLIASHRWSGAAEPTVRLAAAQRALGHDVLLSATTGASLDRQAQELGVPTTNAVRWRRSYLPHHKWRDFRNLHGLITAWEPDVVHAHLTHDHMMVALALGQPGPGKPLLLRTLHREGKLRTDPLTRGILVRRTGAFATISEAMRRRVIERWAVPAERVSVFAGGVDTARFCPTDRGALLRARWGIPTEAPVVGIVSRLRVERGVQWMLDAAVEALAQMPDARLVICGRGTFVPEMERRLAAHPRREQIVYAGYVTGADLEDAYNAFDVSLLLKPGNDGACRAAQEAMACGKPVIGGRIGAIAELVCEDGPQPNGWLVDEDDIAGLSAAMRASLANLEETRRRGAHARQRILADYSELANAERMIQFCRAQIPLSLRDSEPALVLPG